MTCLKRGYKFRAPSAACFVLAEMLKDTGERMLAFTALGLLLIATSTENKFTNITSIKRVLVLDHVRCSEFNTFCPNGYSCIYWEEYCPSQPCRLFPFCRLTPEVTKWNAECREIGCSAESCFLRQRRDCDFIPCDFYADCVFTEGHRQPFDPVDPCQSYICPKGYSCLAKMEECDKEECTAQISCISTHRKKKLDARYHYAMFRKVAKTYQIKTSI